MSKRKGQSESTPPLGDSWWKGFVLIAHDGHCVDFRSISGCTECRITTKYADVSNCEAAGSCLTNSSRRCRDSICAVLSGGAVTTDIDDVKQVAALCGGISLAQD